MFSVRREQSEAGLVSRAKKGLQKVAGNREDIVEIHNAQLALNIIKGAAVQETEVPNEAIPNILTLPLQALVVGFCSASRMVISQAVLYSAKAKCGQRTMLVDRGFTVPHQYARRDTLLVYVQRTATLMYDAHINSLLPLDVGAGKLMRLSFAC